METVTAIPASPQQAVARTLKALKRHRDLTDGQLAALVGMSRSKVQSKMSGTTGCDAEELFLFAQAFGVEPYVLLMPKSEALRWVLDNPRPTGPPTGGGGPVIDLRSYACTRHGTVVSTPGQVGDLSKAA